MRHRIHSSLLAGLVVIASCCACSSSTSSGSTSSGSTSSGSSSGDGGPSDCVVNPTSHLDILNGCTNAVRITKNPALTKLLADGGLPPVN